MNEALIPDIPRLYTAIAEWAACMGFVLVSRKRFNGIKFWLLAAACLVAFVGYQYLAGLLPLYLWIPGMAGAMLLIFGCIYLLNKTNPMGAVMWAAKAFVLAEFAASLEWQFHYYLFQQFPRLDSPLVNYAFLILVYALVFVSIFFLEKRYCKTNMSLNVTGRELISVVGIALVVFLISNISFISYNTPLSGKNAGEIFYIRTLVNFCGIVLFYAQQEQRLWLHARLELSAMQGLLNRQYEQYCLTHDNIEMLNRKYHDLKHQITAIKSEENPKKRTEYINEMEKRIKLYEAQNETGNKVLDTILFSKSAYCIDHDVNFTCVADGTLLKFMGVMDICSIVGNALDNAIESVCKLSDCEKRLVKMAVYAQNDLLMMRFENYTESSPSFENGLPVTTKADKNFHGYGVKSIKTTAERYDGNMTITVQNNWFTLCLLFPLKKEKIT